MRVSCKLLFTALSALHTIALATSSPILPSSTPDSIVPPTSIPSPIYPHHHQHLTAPFLKKRADNSTLSVESEIVYGWVDYFDINGTFLTEAVTSTNTCYKLMPIMPSNWSILQVIPQTLQATYETDQLLVFTDDACVTPSRYTRAQILPMAIVTTYYRYGVPLSFKWSRYSTLLPNTSTTTSSSTSSTTVKELPTATYRPNFQTAILPPKPSSWWNKPCDDGQNSTTCTTTKNNNSTRDIVIVGVTVSILAVGFLTAGAFYIYRTFYTSPDSNGSDNVISSDAIFKSNTRSNTSTLNGVNPNTDTDTDPSRFNSSYVYNHDEDENTRPKFMFDHRHDNINTNRNPKLFKENPSSSRAQNNNPSIHIPLQPRSSGSGQMSPSSELSLLVRTKK